MNSFKVTFLGATLAAISACSSGPVVQDYPPTANPTEEVTKLNDEMNVAIKAQVDVLSPHNFHAASESLKDAQRSLEKREDASDTLHLVAQGHAHLTRATAVAETARHNIEDVVSARQAALTANVTTFLPREFSESDDHLRDVTADLENNDAGSSTKRRAGLQAEYLDLELKSIKQANLDKANEAVRTAKTEGAEEFAPRSLAIAQKSILDTDAYITANRHDTDHIKARSAKTLADANLLVKITRASKSGTKTSSEDTALTMENNRIQAAQTQAATQAKLSASQTQLDATKTDLVASQGALVAEEGTNQALTAQNTNLTADQAFNQSFEEARAKFTPAEAEVYKQGDTLVIRLRGLEFPTAQAGLQGATLPLLAKVSDVIKKFGKSKVVVEGHTDSLGDKAQNEKLSSARAEAVKQYLVSAGTTDADVTAIGYGYEKPLASNKTKDGRAQNRRVDVRIQAVQPAAR